MAVFFRIIDIFANINLVLSGVFVAGLSLLYREFYRITRHMPWEPWEHSRGTWIRFILCVLLNIFGAVRLIPIGTIDHLFLVLLMMIADIDILIGKIPTELLVLLAVVSGIIIKEYPRSVFFWLYCILFSIPWVLFREKLGIAVYDLILLFILMAVILDIEELLIYNALVLILWGITGVILRFVFRKDKHTRIPLAPIIASAYLISVSLL